ncbi:MAG: amino acid ABC transporter ATP-binding protein [Kiritimatiellae bacterium]|nr:amino acid ABC transporter ATP-binding protein [Kiritimatiellia bacterium]
MATGKETLLKVRDLRKSFGRREVLRGVSLDVARGDVVALLGRSGSGKTTLLRCLDFLETADSGVILREGFQLADFSRRIPRSVIRAMRLRSAFVFQEHGLFANLTALQNVAEGLVTARGMARDKAERIAMAALEKVEMADRADAWPSQLSGGQRQRVGIARAIAPDPDMIFLDEPTSSLDPALVDGILDLLRTLARDGRTMIMATHQIAFAHEVATRTIRLENGLVADETAR